MTETISGLGGAPPTLTRQLFLLLATTLLLVNQASATAAPSAANDTARRAADRRIKKTLAAFEYEKVLAVNNADDRDLHNADGGSTRNFIRAISSELNDAPKDLSLAVTGPHSAERQESADEASLFSVSSSARLLTAASECLDMDETVSAATGRNCSDFVTTSQCEVYFCSTCVLSGLCDASCGYCALTPTIAPSVACLDDDDTVSAATGGYDCATVASYGMCDTYACPTCSLAGLCDASCTYCTSTPTAVGTIPTVAPSVTPTTGCVDDDAALVSAFGADCSTVSAMGYCDSYFCSTCGYAGYCDVSCAYCPTPAPTSSACGDDDETMVASFGADCPTVSAMGYCGSYFCPTCGYAGYCDASCGYCPTPAPTTVCVDDDTTMVATFGADCPTVSAMGYCSSYFCPTCGYSGYCDVSCGFCAVDAVAPSAIPTLSPVPTTMPPTPTPTPVPTTASPSISAVPTTSQAPTLSGKYDISNHADLSDAVASAEEGREWVLTVMNDIVANSSIVLPSHSLIKVIGSSALGRRVKVTPGSGDLSRRRRATTAGRRRLHSHDDDIIYFLDASYSKNITLWVENFEFFGFTYYAIQVGGAHSSISVKNGRFVDGYGGIRLRNAPHSTVIVHDSEFVAMQDHGIAVGDSSSAVDSSSSHLNLFVRGSEFIGLGSTGIYVSQTSHHLTVTVHDSKFSGIEAMAIWLPSSQSTLVVNSSEFTDNYRVRNSGAGIHLGGSNEEGIVAVITNTLFARNVVPRAGAAIYAWKGNSQLTIRNCTLP